MVQMSFKIHILNYYLSKELPLTGTVLLFNVRQAISFSTSYLRDLRSYGTACSVEGYFLTDVSGPPINPILKSQDFLLLLEYGTNSLS